MPRVRIRSLMIASVVLALLLFAFYWHWESKAYRSYFYVCLRAEQTELANAAVAEAAARRLSAKAADPAAPPGERISIAEQAAGYTKQAARSREKAAYYSMWRQRYGRALRYPGFYAEPCPPPGEPTD